MKRCSYVVRGRVQGVGFRWFVKKAAEHHGLAGWVRNEADGSVTGEVEGDGGAVDAFFDQVRQGPRMARVDDLAFRSVPVVGDVGFGVR